MAKNTNLRSISSRFKRLYVYLIEEEYTYVWGETVKKAVAHL